MSKYPLLLASPFPGAVGGLECRCRHSLGTTLLGEIRDGHGMRDSMESFPVEEVSLWQRGQGFVVCCGWLFMSEAISISW